MTYNVSFGLFVNSTNLIYDQCNDNYEIKFKFSEELIKEGLWKGLNVNGLVICERIYDLSRLINEVFLLIIYVFMEKVR